MMCESRCAFMSHICLQRSLPQMLHRNSCPSIRRSPVSGSFFASDPSGALERKAGDALDLKPISIPACTKPQNYQPLPHDDNTRINPTGIFHAFHPGPVTISSGERCMRRSSWPIPPALQLLSPCPSCFRPPLTAVENPYRYIPPPDGGPEGGTW